MMRTRTIAVWVLAGLWLATALAGVFHHHDHSDPMGEHCALCLALQTIAMPALALVLALFSILCTAVFVASNAVLPLWQCRGCIPLRSPPLSA